MNDEVPERAAHCIRFGPTKKTLCVPVPRSDPIVLIDNEGAHRSSSENAPKDLFRIDRHVVGHLRQRSFFSARPAVADRQVVSPPSLRFARNSASVADVE
jgi:hypothetical protein